MIFKYIILIFLLNQLDQICADYYTSVSSLEELLYTEQHFVEEVEEYVRQVTFVNQKLKRFLDKIEENIADIQKNSEEFYEKPNNYLKVLKRFAIDWQLKILTVLNDDKAMKFSKKLIQMTEENYPNASRADLIGASNALVRLQSTYALTAEDISDGKLLENQYDSQLSAHDCFELGRTLYEANNYHYAAEWLIRARILLAYELEEAGLENENGNNYFPFITDIEILESLAPTMFGLGNWKMASIFNDELLSQEPDNEFGLENKDFYRNKILQENHWKLQIVNIEQETSTASKILHIDKIYESVCRGSLRQNSSEQRNLHCRYTTKNVPFCLIAPFKMEELSHDPFVAVYYDAIYDNEMQQIINVAQNDIERSEVGDSDNPSYSELRTSQNSWLAYEEHEFLKPIAQRLQDITGLSLLYAEPLQVANYGIGGHYASHYDFFEDRNVTSADEGDRLLTALFYINNVELGGATAFPFLRIAVPPIRGSLLVWYNMHESLELDYRTIHAGCPVLKGSKWICNEWFNEVGQEFLRPCSLERNGKISLPYKTKC